MYVTRNSSGDEIPEQDDILHNCVVEFRSTLNLSSALTVYMSNVLCVKHTKIPNLCKEVVAPLYTCMLNHWLEWDK